MNASDLEMVLDLITMRDRVIAAEAERDRLRDEVAWLRAMTKDGELVALRGRVEELTEALRALVGAVDDPDTWDRQTDTEHAIDAATVLLLARVVPEKETP